jgi:hypothetical protein
MCYSVESSLKTTAISLFAIIYLLTSNIPHFQWLGITLIGWCGMQFAELLLWLTDPRKGCTMWNKIITMTLIPFALILQPLGSLFGSLYVIPWNKSSDLRKNFIKFYSLFVILALSYTHFYKPEKICTTVTEQGHLFWNTKIDDNAKHVIIRYVLWTLISFLPMGIFWNKNYLLLALILIMPTVGFITGWWTDSRGSIWCHYTSYASIFASVCLFLHQSGIYKFA